MTSSSACSSSDANVFEILNKINFDFKMLNLQLVEKWVSCKVRREPNLMDRLWYTLPKCRWHLICVWALVLFLDLRWLWATNNLKIITENIRSRVSRTDTDSLNVSKNLPYWYCDKIIFCSGENSSECVHSKYEITVVVLLGNPDVVTDKVYRTITRLLERISSIGGVDKSILKMFRLVHLFEIFGEIHCFVLIQTFCSVRCKCFGTEQVDFFVFVCSNERKTNVNDEQIVVTYFLQNWF